VDFEKRIKEYGTRDDISHIFVVSPVPLMFLTPLMASIAYLAEKVHTNSLSRSDRGVDADVLD
jgi:hypothetical protein